VLGNFQSAKNLNEYEDAQVPAGSDILYPIEQASPEMQPNVDNRSKSAYSYSSDVWILASAFKSMINKESKANTWKYVDKEIKNLIE
jgi:hypothetical protein